MTQYVLNIPGDGTWNFDLGPDMGDFSEADLSNNDTISFDGDQNADDLNTVIFEKRGSVLVLTSPDNSAMKKVSTQDAATYTYSLEFGWLLSEASQEAPNEETEEEVVEEVQKAPEPSQEMLNEMMAQDINPTEDSPEEVQEELTLLEEAVQEQPEEEAVLATPIYSETRELDLDDYDEHEFLVALEKVSKIQYDLSKKYGDAKFKISQLELEAVERDEEIANLKEQLATLTDQRDELWAENEDMSSQLEQITKVLKG